MVSDTKRSRKGADNKLASVRANNSKSRQI